jgi:hypothetical protein
MRPTKQKRKAAQQQPYADFEKLPIWKVVSRAITTLVNNGDLDEKTAHTHVVGFICKSLVEAEKAKSQELKARSFLYSPYFFIK